MAGCRWPQKGVTSVEVSPAPPPPSTASSLPVWTSSVPCVAVVWDTAIRKHFEAAQALMLGGSGITSSREPFYDSVEEGEWVRACTPEVAGGWERASFSL